MSGIRPTAKSLFACAQKGIKNALGIPTAELTPRLRRSVQTAAVSQFWGGVFGTSRCSCLSLRWGCVCASLPASWLGSRNRLAMLLWFSRGERCRQNFMHWGYLLTHAMCVEFVFDHSIFIQHDSVEYRVLHASNYCFNPSNSKIS